jgi:hypothetical protein
MTQNLTPPAPEILEQVRTGFKAGTVVYEVPEKSQMGLKIKKYPSSDCYLVEYSVFHLEASHQWKAMLIIDGKEIASEYIEGKTGEISPSDLIMIFKDLESLAKIAEER